MTILEKMSRKTAQMLGLRKYYTGKPCANGHETERFTSNGACVECLAGWRREWHTYNRQNDKDYRLSRQLLGPKTRAREYGIPFDLEVSDLDWPTHCPALGIPLDYGPKEGRGPKPNSPSIDRLDPAKGYVKGNVIVVSSKANSIKSNATVEEIEAVARFYRSLRDAK